MGIIAEFEELNYIIEKSNNKSSHFNLISKIKYNKQKKRLLEILDKFRRTNAPLKKEDILEFAGSIYSNYIPNGEFKNVKVQYFPKANAYNIGITLHEEFRDNIIQYSSIDVSSEERGMGIYITLKNIKDDNVMSTKITSKNYSTNVREIKDEIQYVNMIIIDLIADYIENNIK